MKTLWALAKYASVALFAGLLVNNGLDLGNSIVPLLGLMLVVSAVVVFYEMAMSEPVAARVALPAGLNR